ncbi:MAG: hypothetical protein U1C74_15890 [Phenylobacterium sp.]|nr:hypothetical protein [Phenylobacterium sp.]
MSSVIVWAGRAALLAVFAVAFAGAINPRHNAAANAPPPDVVEHVVYGYLLTLFSIISLPRISPWLIGGFFLLLATAFEVAQVLGLVSGTFQWKDMGANAGGVLAALVPVALGRFRR